MHTAYAQNKPLTLKVHTLKNLQVQNAVPMMAPPGLAEMSTAAQMRGKPTQIRLLGLRQAFSKQLLNMPLGAKGEQELVG